MKPGDFRPVFAAADAEDPAQAPLEVEAARWFRRAQGKTNDQVRDFCERLAARYGLRLTAIDVAQPGLGAAFGRFDRLRLTPRAVKDAEAEFGGRPV